MMSQVQSAIRYITSLPRVPGKEPWSISPQDCLDLAWMMDAVAQGRRDLRIAEIGTFRGQSAVLLACWAGEGHGMVTTADVQTHPGTDAIIQGAKWARDRIARTGADDWSKCAWLACDLIPSDRCQCRVATRAIQRGLVSHFVKRGRVGLVNVVAILNLFRGEGVAFSLVCYRYLDHQRCGRKTCDRCPSFDCERTFCRNEKILDRCFY
jgi:hypothetical protein